MAERYPCNFYYIIFITMVNMNLEILAEQLTRMESKIDHLKSRMDTYENNQSKGNQHVKELVNSNRTFS